MNRTAPPRHEVVDPGAPALVPEPGAALLAGAALAALAGLAAARRTLQGG